MRSEAVIEWVTRPGSWPRRDRRAVDYGTYTLVDIHGDTLVDAGERMTIDDVEEYLTGA